MALLQLLIVTSQKKAIMHLNNYKHLGTSLGYLNEVIGYLITMARYNQCMEEEAFINTACRKVFLLVISQ